MRSAYNEVKIKYSLSKNLLLIKNGVAGAKPPKHTQPFTGKGVFGKDAEIRTH